MKRFALLAFVVLLAWTVSLVSCTSEKKMNTETDLPSLPAVVETETKSDSSDLPSSTETASPSLPPMIESGTETDPSEPPLDSEADSSDVECEVTNIIDRTVIEMIPTDSALELFWSDEFNDYYFPSIRSEYVIVECSNGDTYCVTDALEYRIITIEDLDCFGISYYTEQTRVPDAEDCVLLSVNILNEPSGSASPYATELYDDGEFMYFLPNASYTFTVTYTNGYTESAYSALSREVVTFDDLDSAGVEYIEVSHSNFGKCGVKEIVDLEVLGYMKNEFPGGMYDDTFDIVYEDDVFYYTLHTPYEAAVIVVYNDNTTERIKDALVAGRVKISDLEKYAIDYEKYTIK